MQDCKIDEETVPLNPNSTPAENISRESSSQPTTPIAIVNLNGQHRTTKMSATIRSSDGKLHQIALEAELIKITLLNRKSQPTRHVLKIPLDFLVCIRSSQIPLHSGLPRRDLRKETAESSINADSQIDNRHYGTSDVPNVLYLYYTYRWNVYTWRLREAAFFFPSTSDKKHWADVLENIISNRVHRPKSLLIFINPFGGKGKANRIWEKEVEPIFKLADINYEVVKTERADHALDSVYELSPNKWESIDGIVSVGGDGLFNEVLSAAIIRTQIEHGKDYHNPEIGELSTARVRFGIIGAGSANSIVSSVYGINDCPTSAIHIAIGSKCSVDVCAVYEDSKLLRFSADAISYGWLGDVLHDSERYRCLGPIRYQYSALRTSIRHPTYFGRVSFALSQAHPVPNQNADDSGSGPSNPLKIPPCTGPCDICSGKILQDENFPYHWQSDFTHVICCVIPCVSPFTPYGLAPYTGLSDGTMDLALIPKVSRFTNMQIMRKVAMYGAKFIRSEYPDVKVFRVSRWKFTPKNLLTLPESGAAAEEESGAWNLDGEILPQPPNKPLHFRLHPRLIDFFGRDTDVDLDDPRYSQCCVGCCKREHKISQLIIKVAH